MSPRRVDLTPAALEERSIPEPNTGCWLWLRAVDPKLGYGSLKFGQRIMRAHRASWLAHRGPIPAGLCVCHRCDNRMCINPEHLFLGTRKDNAQDAAQKHRTTYGVRHHAAKLDPDSVRAIRAGSSVGRTQIELARDFGVSRASISLVVNRHVWRRVN